MLIYESNDQATTCRQCRCECKDADGLVQALQETAGEDGYEAPCQGVTPECSGVHRPSFHHPLR